MRASLPSFTDKVAAFRESLIAGNPPRDKDFHIAMGILSRLEQHPDANSIWDKFKSKFRYAPAATGPDPAAGFFIARILKAGFLAYGANRVVHELPNAEKKAVSNIKRRLDEGQYDQALERLSLLSSAHKSRKELLSQKTETAARQRFMVTQSDFFEQNCGLPFYNEVATLTNIVFDLRPKDNDTPRAKIEVTWEQVRDAVRKARSTPTPDTLPTSEPLPPTMVALSEVTEPMAAHWDI
jgi:hypothetical protein